MKGAEVIVVQTAEEKERGNGYKWTEMKGKLEDGGRDEEGEDGWMVE